MRRLTCFVPPLYPTEAMNIKFAKLNFCLTPKHTQLSHPSVSRIFSSFPNFSICKKSFPRGVSSGKFIFAKLAAKKNRYRNLYLLTKWLHRVTGGHKFFIVGIEAHATLPIPFRDERTFTRISANEHHGDGVVRPGARQPAGEQQQARKQSGWDRSDCGKGKGELVRHAGKDSSN